MKYSKYVLFLFGIFFCQLYTFESNYWFSFISIKELLEQNNFDIKYQECFGLVQCDVVPFSVVPETLTRMTFWECFILTLPNAQVQAPCGYILKNQKFLFDMLWGGQLPMLDNLVMLEDYQIAKISGRVAVIANLGFQSYSHWLDEVLGRLALLEMNDVEYDWLYVPYFKSYMQETLDLWGVDTSKIIVADDYYFGVQAEQLIVPSYVIDTVEGKFKHIGLYVHPYTAYYVRDKLLHAVQAKNMQHNFSKRVFISRQDAPWRNIINEDEIFNYLKQFGFDRYELSKLSVAEQIVLFSNAEVVIGAHGTGLVNCMFCRPGTKVVEIFQELIDNSFWYLSHLFKLEYFPVQTMPINKELYLDWTNHYDDYEKVWASNSYVPLFFVKNAIKKLGLL